MNEFFGLTRGISSKILGIKYLVAKLPAVKRAIFKQQNVIFYFEN